MGRFDALATAVAGLQAQSYALQNISGNIANSQTTGYKETGASFADLVSAAAPRQQTAGGVISASVATNNVQGSIQSASVSTDTAINGNRFFVVQQPTGFIDNKPNFSGVNNFTRAGRGAAFFERHCAVSAGSSSANSKDNCLGFPIGGWSLLSFGHRRRGGTDSGLQLTLR